MQFAIPNKKQSLRTVTSMTKACHIQLSNSKYVRLFRTNEQTQVCRRRYVVEAKRTTYTTDRQPSSCPSGPQNAEFTHSTSLFQSPFVPRDLALSQARSRVRVAGDDAFLGRLAVRPPVVVTELRLPAPEDPSEILLVSLHLACPPLGVESVVGLVLRVPVRGVLELIFDGERPFSDDDGRVAVFSESVSARSGEVAGLRVFDVGPLEVAMVIIGDVCVGANDVFGVSGTPCGVHELDSKSLFGGNVGILLALPDLGESGGVVLANEVRVIALRLVEHLEHAGGAVLGVTVNAVGHYLEEPVCALELVGLVEACCAGVLDTGLVYKK
jgi:hypothetical protein